mmetsp:Transcript_39260/g.125176  ORF Transcript_39260/g.125176 Transcript_39260/m.125176 type:complete len:225 (-) Transcript_39260:60-734(-)
MAEILLPDPGARAGVAWQHELSAEDAEGVVVIHVPVEVPVVMGVGEPPRVLKDPVVLLRDAIGRKEPAVASGSHRVATMLRGPAVVRGVEPLVDIVHRVPLEAVRGVILAEEPLRDNELEGDGAVVAEDVLNDALVGGGEVDSVVVLVGRHSVPGGVLDHIIGVAAGAAGARGVAGDGLGLGGKGLRDVGVAGVVRDASGPGSARELPIAVLDNAPVAVLVGDS